eukprot:580988-Hanusia_phi.AAC.5
MMRRCKEEASDARRDCGAGRTASLECPVEGRLMEQSEEGCAKILRGREVGMDEERCEDGRRMVEVGHDPIME